MIGETPLPFACGYLILVHDRRPGVNQGGILDGGGDDEIDLMYSHHYHHGYCWCLKLMLLVEVECVKGVGESGVVDFHDGAGDDVDDIPVVAVNSKKV